MKAGNTFDAHEILARLPSVYDIPEPRSTQKRHQTRDDDIFFEGYIEHLKSKTFQAYTAADDQNVRYNLVSSVVPDAKRRLKLTWLWDFDIRTVMASNIGVMESRYRCIQSASWETVMERRRHNGSLV